MDRIAEAYRAVSCRLYDALRVADELHERTLRCLRLAGVDAASGDDPRMVADRALAALADAYVDGWNDALEASGGHGLEEELDVKRYVVQRVRPPRQEAMQRRRRIVTS